jgi:hypothetical protein
MSVGWQGEKHIQVPPVGDFPRSVSLPLPSPHSQATIEYLAAAAVIMDEQGPSGGESRSWPWWTAASEAQVATGVAWFRRGRGGLAVAMPLKAFAIASLFVGSGATAVAAGVSAAGIGSVRRRSQNSAP